MVPLYELDMEERCDFFGKEIDHHPWVVFHGTSGLFELAIETDGLKPNNSPISSNDIAKIVGIYKTLDWQGYSSAGYDILNSFSLGYDRKYCKLPSIFLAESSFRACLYGSKDHAGGEAARAGRYALRDLWKYLDHEERSLSVSQRGWLKNELIQLDSVRKRLEAIFDSHPYGLVYAIEVTEEYIESFSYDQSMGVKSSRNILPSRLIAKLKIPPSYKHEFGTDYRRILRPLENGLIKTLENRG
jgi:hypothetical protein